MSKTKQLSEDIADRHLEAKFAIHGLESSTIHRVQNTNASASITLVVDDMSAGSELRYDYSRGYVDLPFRATFTRRGFGGAGPIIPEYISDGIALPPSGWVSHVMNCTIASKDSSIKVTEGDSANLTVGVFGVASYWLSLLKDTRDVFLESAYRSGRSRVMPRDEMNSHVSGHTFASPLATTWSNITRNCYITPGLEVIVGGAQRPFYGREARQRGLLDRLIGMCYPITQLASEKSLPYWTAVVSTPGAAAATYTITLNYRAFVPLRDLSDLFRVMPVTHKGFSFTLNTVEGAVTRMGVSETDGPGADYRTVVGNFPLKLTDRVTCSEFSSNTLSENAAGSIGPMRKDICTVPPGTFESMGVGGKSTGCGGRLTIWGTGLTEPTGIRPVVGLANIAGSRLASFGDQASLAVSIGIGTTVAGTQGLMQDVTSGVALAFNPDIEPSIFVPRVMVNPQVVQQLQMAPARVAFEQFVAYRPSLPQVAGSRWADFSLGAAYKRCSRIVLIPVRGVAADISGMPAHNRIWSHEPCLPSIGFRVCNVEFRELSNVKLHNGARDNDSLHLAHSLANTGLYDAHDLAGVCVVDLRDYPPSMRKGEIKISFDVTCSLPGADGVAMCQVLAFGFDESEVIMEERPTAPVAVTPQIAQ